MGRHVGIGAPERVLFRLLPIPFRAINRVRADLHDSAAKGDAIANGAARHGAGGDAGRRFAGTGAPAAAIVAHAVFRVIGEVGMAGAVAVADFAIVLGALVGVLDHQGNRRSGGHRPAGAVVLEHAGQDLDRVRFLALGDEARGAGAALVEEALNPFRC